MPIVQATNLDSVRIEILGEGRAITIPASLLLAADRVLREALVRDDALTIEPLEDETSVEPFWEAWIGNIVAQGSSPWGAVQELAKKLETET